jgi:hypothetical protein
MRVAILYNPRAALFEWIGVPFTGSRSDTLALCPNKRG